MEIESPNLLPLTISSPAERSWQTLQARPNSATTREPAAMNASCKGISSVTKAKHVGFLQAQIRLYPMILGDNPGCKGIGAPVSLGWDYEEMPSMSVDYFEETRKGFRRNNVNDLLLARNQRLSIILANGFTMEELASAEKEISKIQSQRKRSAMRFIPVSMVEDLALSTGRKLKNEKRCLTEMEEREKVQKLIRESLKRLKAEESCDSVLTLAGAA